MLLLFFYSSPCYVFMFFSSSTIYYLFSSDANFGLYREAFSIFVSHGDPLNLHVTMFSCTN
jgi:hypothetical protein